MNRIRFLLVFLMFVSLKAFAGVDCEKLNRAGEDATNIVPDFGSGRDIVGKDRLQFYTGPHLSCKMDGWFVVPGDTLFAKYAYNGFTEVSFIPMKKSDRDVTAWVISSRLRENGKGIEPGHAPDTEEIGTLLKNGESAISQRKFGSAIEICRNGLDSLGDAYWSNDIIDDTDVKLASADVLRQNGKIENAASFYCRVLADRLAIYNKNLR